MWPIKWKEILYRITIWNQKMSQYNSLESVLQIGLIFFYFDDYSKSARGMILFLLVTCSYIPIPLKNAEKPTVIWLSTENFFKSTVCYSATWSGTNVAFYVKAEISESQSNWSGHRAACLSARLPRASSFLSSSNLSSAVFATFNRVPSIICQQWT